jgi:hypothetical protein
MPALNFDKRFSGMVLSGTKTQTIRKPRKHPFKVGQTAYLYTGMRTKNCRKLGGGGITRVLPIEIASDTVVFPGAFEGYEVAFMGDTLELFARDDGFESWEEMREWFRETYGLPFRVVLVEWELREDMMVIEDEKEPVTEWNS